MTLSWPQIGKCVAWWSWVVFWTLPGPNAPFCWANDMWRKKHELLTFSQKLLLNLLWSLVFEPRAHPHPAQVRHRFFFASKVCHMCYHHALRDMNNLLTVIQSCNALHSPSWMRIVVDIRSDPLPDATFHHTVSKSAGVVAKQAGKTQACWSLQRPGREGDTLHGFPGFWAIKQRKKFNQHVLKSCWLDPRVQQGVLKQTFIQERKDSLVLRQWFTSWTLSCCYGYQFVASMPGLTPNSKAAKSGEAKTPWPIDFFH